MLLASRDSVTEASVPDEVTDWDEHQDTEPFDDTIIADSPLSETQLESQHADTAVLDSDIDKVVLDSDDEEIQRTEAASLTNKLPSGKSDTSLEGAKVITEKRQLSPATNQSYVDEVTDWDKHQDTEPFDDTILADSPFSETQLESEHADTAVLDSDIDKVVLDSDDEEIQRPEAASLTNKLPSGKSDTILEGAKVITEKRQLSPATNQSYVGYFRRRVSKIRSCSIFKGGNTGPESIYAEAIWKKQHNVKGNENGGECQAAMHGNVKDGAVGNRNWDCDSKTASSVDDMKDIDVEREISTADVQAEMEVPLSKYEAVDGRKATLLVTDGHDLSTLSYVDSEEPGEHSQANALSVVDHYLSVIDVSLSPDVERVKVTRMVAPPTSFGKGSQALARQANLRTTQGEFGRFDWSGNKADDLAGFHVKNRKEGVLGHKDDRQESVSTFQHFSDLNPKKDNDFGIAKLQMTIANNEHKDSTKMAVNINETCEMMQATELKSESNLANQLDNKADLESFAQQPEVDVIERDEPDLFDVGFDTQLAAEAMEALMYVPPPSPSISSLPALGNLPEDPSRGGVLTGASKCSSFHAGDGSEVIAKDTKRKVRSLGKLKKINFSPSKIDANENKLGSKLTRRKRLTSQTLPVRETNIKEAGSSKSVKRDSLIVKRRGYLKSSSPFPPSTRQSLLVHSTQNIEGSPCGSRERLNCIVKEVDCLGRGTKRRKLDSVNFQVVDMKNKLPKTISSTHSGATNCNAKKQMQIDSSVNVTTSYLKLDTWTYPKRKRTHPKVLNHLRKASNHCASSAALHGKNGSTQSVGLPQKSEANIGANSSILQAVRKPRSICQVQPLSDKKCVEFREDSVAEYNVSHAQGGTGVGKQMLKKISSKSPLIKELSRLGLQNRFRTVSKDLRRRRNIANVQILFSQSLDDDIRKQQNKILAQLGISVASCCSEATHFITDKFVRTRNMLESIALGKPVVTPLWLENCAEAGCLVDEEKFILRDTKKEKEIGFDLSTSLTRARHHPLLKDQKVLITQNVKPCKEMIESLVKSVNGQPVENILIAARDKLIREDLLILSCEEDYTTCVPFLEKGVHVFSSELLLSGIVTQKLEYLRHQLFSNYAKKKCTKVYSRRARTQV